jgi:hypothetical protein
MPESAVLVVIAAVAGAVILFLWYRQHSKPRLGPGWTTIGGKRYWTTSAWANNALMPDARLRAALAYAYHSHPTWRPIADRAASLGTRVRWGILPYPIDGLYQVHTRTITISTRCQALEKTASVASILVHESWHAAFPSCTDDRYLTERLAYTGQAAFWARVRQGSPQTELERHLDELLAHWRNGTLPDYVARLLHPRPAPILRPLVRSKARPKPRPAAGQWTRLERRLHRGLQRY